MQNNDSIHNDFDDDGYEEYDDGRYDNVAGLYDRFSMALTSLIMLAERQGWVSDDDVLDAADRWTLEARDADGCFARETPADYDQLVKWLFEWLEENLLLPDEEEV